MEDEELPLVVQIWIIVHNYTRWETDGNQIDPIFHDHYSGFLTHQQSDFIGLGNSVHLPPFLMVFLYGLVRIAQRWDFLVCSCHLNLGLLFGLSFINEVLEGPVPFP